MSDGSTSTARATTVAALLTALLGWASAFPAIRLALAELGPVELSAARFAVAALPAGVLLTVRRRPLPPRRAWWRLIFLGLVFVAGYSVLLNVGERSVPAGTAAFIVNLNVVMTAGLSAGLLRERLARRAWVGMVVSLLGLLLLVAGGSGPVTVDRGALFVLGAAIAYAVSTIVQKPLLADVDPLSVACITILIGAAALLPALPGAARQAAGSSAAACLAVAYLGIVPSFVAYAGWAVALSRLPAARAANFLYCVPPLSTLLAVPLLGELPSALSLAGGAVIIAGVVIVNGSRSGGRSTSDGNRSQPRVLTR